MLIASANTSVCPSVCVFPSYWQTVSQSQVHDGKRFPPNRIQLCFTLPQPCHGTPRSCISALYPVCWITQHECSIQHRHSKARWSLYVPHSGHYMYRTAVTICTAQRSLYIAHSGHYMYRTVVTICTAQWSLYVPHSGHYMYRQFNIHKSYVLPTQLYLCVLCGSQNKRLFPYTALTDWFV